MRKDPLTFAFVLAALFCLLVSVPATYELTLTTHHQISAILLLLVFELTAFGSKVSIIWLPHWAKVLDRLTIALLTITALANGVSGWNHLMTADLTGVWQWIAAATLWGFPIGAALLVTVTATLVPLGQYLFLSLAIARQRELARAADPQTAAARELEPITRKLAELEHLYAMLLRLGPPVITQQRIDGTVEMVPTPVLPSMAYTPPLPDPGTMPASGASTAGNGVGHAGTMPASGASTAGNGVGHAGTMPASGASTAGNGVGHAGTMPASGASTAGNGVGHAGTMPASGASTAGNGVGHAGTMPASGASTAGNGVGHAGTMPADMLAHTVVLATAPEDSPSLSGRFACPSCGHPLTQGQFGAAQRHGHCRYCRPK